MKAIQIKQYGDADVLEITQIPEPTPSTDQLLIENKAIGINPFDWKLRNGLFQDLFPLEFPNILGFEIAGVVKQVPDHVKNIRVGDRVYGKADHAYAEFVSMDVSQAHHIPESMSFEQAAALSTNTQVAYNVLVTLGKLKKGQKVLIHAGAGGVGIAAIQIAKYLGADITTTVSPKNIEFVKSLGANHVIDYTNTSLDQIQERYDLILDSIGAKTQIESWELLKQQGLLVSLLGDESAHFSKSKFDRKFIFAVDVLENHSDEIHDLILGGHIQPIIDEVFEFHDMAKAHNKSEFGHVTGKIIVKV